jgi:SPP1 gp7 family putative phage head morphogenesis protein
VTIQEIAARYRQRIIEREAVALAGMQAAYKDLEEALLLALLALLDDMAEEAGDAPVSWLLRSERLQRLLDQVAVQMGEVSDLQTALITNAQAEAVAMASAAAYDFAYQAHPDRLRVSAEWNRLPVAAFENMVGRMSDGSPLAEVFSRYPQVLRDAVQDSLLQGVGQGQNPRKVAAAIRRRIRTAVEEPGIGSDVVNAAREIKQRSDIIARTEVVSAHRDAALLNYQVNAEPFGAVGYRRISALDIRTCPVCWALHGRLYPVNQPFYRHPQCRCAAAVVFTLEDEDGIGLGPDRFARLSKGDQLSILGPGKYEAFRAGRLALPDVVAEFDDPRWGPSVRERSLRSLVGR